MKPYGTEKTPDFQKIKTIGIGGRGAVATGRKLKAKGRAKARQYNRTLIFKEIKNVTQSR